MDSNRFEFPDHLSEPSEMAHLFDNNIAQFSQETLPSVLIDDKKEHLENTSNVIVNGSDTSNKITSPDLDKFIWNLSEPSVVIRDSTKDRGEPYFVTNKQLTTKKDSWITIEVKDVYDKKFIRVSERYSDECYSHKSVLCNNKCISTLVDMQLENSSFLVKSMESIWRPSVGNDFPSVLLPLQQNYVNVFFIGYRCRNSCDSHKKCGRSRELLLEVLNCKMVVIKTEKYNVRVCESPKRDHLQEGNTVSNRKRSISMVFKQEPQEQYEEQSSSTAYDKVINITDEQPQWPVTDSQHIQFVPKGTQLGQKRMMFDHHHGAHNSMTIKAEKKIVSKNEDVEENFTPKTIIAKMNSKENQELVVQIIKKFGGEVISLM